MHVISRKLYKSHIKKVKKPTIQERGLVGPPCWQKLCKFKAIKTLANWLAGRPAHGIALTNIRKDSHTFAGRQGAASRRQKDGQWNSNWDWYTHMSVDWGFGGRRRPTN